MTRDQLRQAGVTMFGEQWQTPLAEALGVSDRTMRRWISGRFPIPPDIRGRIAAAIGARRSSLASKGRALDVLHRSLEISDDS